MTLTIGFVVTHPFHGSPGSILRVKELSRSLSDLGLQINIYSPYASNEFWGKNITFHRLPDFSSKIGVDEIKYRLTRKVLNTSYLTKYVISETIIEKSITGLAQSLVDNVKDVDILQGEQEIAAAACVKAQKYLQIPIISSLHNIWPEELVAMQLISKNSKQLMYLHKLEQTIVSKPNAVIVVSDAMATYIKENYRLTDSSLTVVPPGGREKVNNIPQRNQPYKIIYSGLVVPRAQVDLFVKAMPYILQQFPNVEFFITNKGEQLKQIKRLAKELGVNPKFYWFKDSSDYYSFLGSCHVGIVTSSDDLPRRMGPAVKLFDYLSVGLPVVANDIGGWTGIIASERIGVLTPSNPKNFSEAVLTLLKNSAVAYQFGENGLRLVKTRLNWASSAQVLLDTYRRILS